MITTEYRPLNYIAPPSPPPESSSSASRPNQIPQPFTKCDKNNHQIVLQVRPIHRSSVHTVHRVMVIINHYHHYRQQAFLLRCQSRCIPEIKVQNLITLLMNLSHFEGHSTLRAIAYFSSLNMSKTVAQSA